MHSGASVLMGRHRKLVLGERRAAEGRDRTETETSRAHVPLLRRIVSHYSVNNRCLFGALSERFSGSSAPVASHLTATVQHPEPGVCWLSNIAAIGSQRAPTADHQQVALCLWEWNEPGRGFLWLWMLPGNQRTLLCLRAGTFYVKSRSGRFT